MTGPLAAISHRYRMVPHPRRESILTAECREDCPRCAVEKLVEAIQRIAEQQPKTMDWLRANEIVFDNLDDHWQKVAFSIYTDLCEVDTIARGALGSFKEET